MRVGAEIVSQPPQYHFRTGRPLPARRPAYVSRVIFGVTHKRVDRLIVHLCQLADKLLLVAHVVINLVDDGLLEKTMVGEKRTSKKRGQGSHGFIAHIGSDETVALHHFDRTAGKLKTILLAIIRKSQLLTHDTLISFFLSVTSVHFNRRGRGNRNVHIDDFINAATNRINAQLTLKLELALRASGGQGSPVASAAKPDSILSLNTFQRLKGGKIGLSVVGREVQRVKRLNTRNVGLHIVRQGSRLKHLRRAAQIREVLDINQFFVGVAGSTLLHQKDTISADSDKSSFLSILHMPICSRPQ
nr:MAG TPA: hypothetical protein [Bacteriophage sp.]